VTNKKNDGNFVSEDGVIDTGTMYMDKDKIVYYDNYVDTSFDSEKKKTEKLKDT